MHDLLGAHIGCISMHCNWELNQWTTAPTNQCNTQQVKQLSFILSVFSGTISFTLPSYFPSSSPAVVGQVSRIGSPTSSTTVAIQLQSPAVQSPRPAAEVPRTSSVDTESEQELWVKVQINLILNSLRSKRLIKRLTTNIRKRINNLKKTHLPRGGGVLSTISNVSLSLYLLA